MTGNPGQTDVYATGAVSTPTGYWRESPSLATKSRREAILAIEDVAISEELLALRGGLAAASSWATNIRSDKYNMPQVFRNAPAINTADDLIEWAEFLVSFVEASFSCPLPQLLRFPPNHHGLKGFLAGRGKGVRASYDGETMLTRKFHGRSA